MLKTTLIKLNALAFAATVLSGTAVQASPIGLNVIPETTCEILIGESPRSVWVRFIVRSSSAGQAKYYFNLDSRLGREVKHYQESGTIRMDANQPKRGSQLYLSGGSKRISARVKIGKDGRSISCSAYKAGINFDIGFGSGAVTR